MVIEEGERDGGPLQVRLPADRGGDDVGRVQPEHVLFDVVLLRERQVGGFATYPDAVGARDVDRAEPSAGL